jgi:transcriptional regulator with XRE-family HTH domain
MVQLRNKTLLKKVAKRIKDLRIAMNITQQKFYFDTDIHIARIEVGEQNISVSTLSAICKYLDISMSEFFRGIE